VIDFQPRRSSKQAPEGVTETQPGLGKKQKFEPAGENRPVFF